MYSMLWCCLYPTTYAAAAFGLNDVGFNDLRSDLSPTPGYLIVVMIIRVETHYGTMLQSMSKRRVETHHGEEGAFASKI